MTVDKIVILVKRHIVEGDIKMGLEYLSNCTLPLSCKEKCDSLLMIYNLNEKDSFKISHEDYQIKRNKIGEGALNLLGKLSKGDFELLNNYQKKTHRKQNYFSFNNLGLVLLISILLVFNVYYMNLSHSISVPQKSKEYDGGDDIPKRIKPYGNGTNRNY